MPRKSSASTPRRRASAKAAFTETPRLISDEEKRELIRVHAAARAPQDPLQRMSLWAGVTLSILGIAVGWWLTVGQGIQQTASRTNEEMRRVTQELNEFADKVEAKNLPFMRPPTPPASAGSFEEVLRANLGSATRTRDLLSAPSATTSTDATTEPSEKEEPVTPDIPGLTPDEE